jgi:hypothetical protein
MYARLAAQCFGDQEYDVVEVRDSTARREAIRKGYDLVETDGEGVSWYRKSKTD